MTTEPGAPTAAALPLPADVTVQTRMTDPDSPVYIEVLNVRYVVDARIPFGTRIYVASVVAQVLIAALALGDGRRLPKLAHVVEAVDFIIDSGPSGYTIVHEILWSNNTRPGGMRHVPDTSRWWSWTNWLTSEPIRAV